MRGRSPSAAVIASRVNGVLRRLARGPCDVRGHRDGERGRDARDSISGDFTFTPSDDGR